MYIGEDNKLRIPIQNGFLMISIQIIKLRMGRTVQALSLENVSLSIENKLVIFALLSIMVRCSQSAVAYRHFHRTGRTDYMLNAGTRYIVMNSLGVKQNLQKWSDEHNQNHYT